MESRTASRATPPNPEFEEVLRIFFERYPTRDVVPGRSARPEAEQRAATRRGSTAIVRTPSPAIARAPRPEQGRRDPELGFGWALRLAIAVAAIGLLPILSSI